MGKKEDFEDGELLYHTACIGEDCTSSDAMAVYKKKDGKLDAFCFSCQGYFNDSELDDAGVTLQETKVHKIKDIEVDFSSIESIKCRGWKERGITRFTSEKYGVHTELDEENNVVSRYYPVTSNGKVVGYKKRTLPKTFIGIGNTKASNELFGQSVFESGQKYLVVTTGEEDAMAFAEVLRNTSGGVEYWTPCVSITAGDGSIIKQFKANYEYLASFSKVVLAFDNDEPGQRYLEEAARILPPGKAFIAKFPRDIKDACDMLKAGKAAELKQVFWKAEPFSRVDVLHLSQMWDDFENEDSNVKIPFPGAWSGLNEMMNGGMEKGEITVLGALTSIGKSTLISNIVYNLIENTNFKVGTMYLESTKREVVRDLLSLDAGINLRTKAREGIDIEALKKRFFEGLARKNQFVYVDHQGSISTSEIFDKLNYLAKAEGCDVIVIDPVQAGVNSSDNGAIIEFMDTLLKFAKETDTAIIAVSHMKKPSEDNPHAVSEYQLMGSSSINQIAFNTILLSRDKMNPDPVKKSATKLQLVKCRRTGNTGEAGWLKYDHETTHLFATSNPYEQVVSEDEARELSKPQNVKIDF
jgi:archaellum biogenesis ATPase FlaH